MLDNFDILVESLLNEGRKSDEVKKFKLNLEKVKNAVESLEDSHEDKGHFKSIVDKLKEKDFYTPKSLKAAVSLIFKQLKKGEIADGYSKLFFEFLKNHDDSPFESYEDGSGQKEPEMSPETEEWFDREEKHSDYPKTEDSEDEEEFDFDSEEKDFESEDDEEDLG